MQAILGGAGAALAWALASLVATRSSRAVGPQVALAWVMAFGLLTVLPILAISDVPDVSGSTATWLVVSGFANVGGLLMAYRALRAGPIGVVAPIIGAEGGVTALISIAAGQPISVPRAIALVAVVVGVVLVAYRVGDGEPGTPGSAIDIPAATLWATLAALTFGLGLYATGKAGADVPVAWAALPPRVLGVLVLTLPMAVRGRLPLPRAVLPYVVAGGVCEVVGFLAYAGGAADDIAVAAVLASLTGAVAAGFGRVVFAEHLSARQLAGVAVLVAAVATLGALA